MTITEWKPNNILLKSCKYIMHGDAALFSTCLLVLRTFKRSVVGEFVLNVYHFKVTVALQSYLLYFY